MCGLKTFDREVHFGYLKVHMNPSVMLCMRRYLYLVFTEGVYLSSVGGHSKFWYLLELSGLACDWRMAQLPMVKISKWNSQTENSGEW